ncbi:MAG: hypothetical protein AAF840_06455 [Bacteroidota bacterium]
MKRYYILITITLLALAVLLFVGVRMPSPTTQTGSLALSLLPKQVETCHYTLTWEGVKGFTPKDAIRDILYYPTGELLVATDGGSYRTVQKKHWQGVDVKEVNTNRVTLGPRGIIYRMYDTNFHLDNPIDRQYQVQFSPNMGTNWFNFTLPQRYTATCYSVDHANRLVFIGGSNGQTHYLSRYFTGKPHEQIVLPAPPIRPEHMVVTKEGHILLASNDALYESRDQGQSFQAVPNGLLTNNRLRLTECIYNAQADVLAATYNGELHISRDHGRTWRTLTAEDACGKRFKYTRARQIADDGTIVTWVQGQFAAVLFHPPTYDSVSVFPIAEEPLSNVMATAVCYVPRDRKLYVAVNDVIPKESRPLISGPFSADIETFFLREGRIITAKLPDVLPAKPLQP